MTTSLVSEVAERTRTLRITVWGFGVGGALSGLAGAGDLLDEPSFVDDVVGLLAPSLTAMPDPTDHLISVEALRMLASVRPGVKVDEACERWTRAVLDAERPRAGGPRVHRPDLSRWSTTIWVDCMHTDGPGLAALGLRDEALAYATEYARVLQRDDGLFHHGYDVATGRGNDVAWGRGQGWALLGLVDTLRLVRDEDLAARLRRLVEALASNEDEGRWHTVVDDFASPIENSVAAFVACGVGRAVASGLVAAEYMTMAERALDCTVAALSAGGLPVSDATPIGHADDYHARAVGVFPWGQGAAMHALLDRLEVEGR